MYTNQLLSFFIGLCLFVLSGHTLINGIINKENQQKRKGMLGLIVSFGLIIGGYYYILTQ
ncbi:MAG: hypothetical protein BGO42_03095 [Flavobacterium sp. 40-81]|nr:MAG: hypothetical protein ABS44_18750 [Chryseobacterium sp. SCN 40-13]OJV68830.1 MAG: hypothetical protein BGO42_03095 [Flavobacterium sp. 40-81]